MRKVARKNMVVVGVIFTTLMLLILVAVSLGFLERHAYFCPVIRQHRCVQNLKNIEKAKADYARDHNLTNGTPIAAEQLVDYIEGGWRGLRCPGKGTYNLNPVGSAPVCSEPAHR